MDREIQQSGAFVCSLYRQAEGTNKMSDNIGPGAVSVKAAVKAETAATSPSKEDAALAAKINTALKALQASLDDLFDRKRAAGLLFAEARERHPGRKAFTAFLRLTNDISYSQAMHLIRGATDYETFKRLQVGNAARQQKFRDKKEAAAVCYVTDNAEIKETRSKPTVAEAVQAQTDGVIAKLPVSWESEVSAEDSAAERKAVYAAAAAEADESVGEIAAAPEEDELAGEFLTMEWERASAENRAAFLDVIGVDAVLANMSPDFERELRGRVLAKTKRSTKSDKPKKFKTLELVKTTTASGESFLRSRAENLCGTDHPRMERELASSAPALANGRTEYC